MNLSFVVNPHKPSTLRVLERIRSVAPPPHRLLLWSEPVTHLRKRADFQAQLDGYTLCDDPRAGDVVVAVGGDGTLLTAVRALQDTLRPLLGINTGSLGFLTEVPEAHVEQAIERLLRGHYRLDPRMLLEAVFEPQHDKPRQFRGLNEIVLGHGPLARVLEIAVHAAGVDLGSTLSDGVIVATPSGSTAYNLSAGGPIVSPRLRSLIVTPINAHTLSMRPLVVSGDESVEVRLLRAPASRCELTVDGYAGCEVGPGDRVVVRAARHDLQLVVTGDTTFYDTLRTKLAWGRRGVEDVP